MPDHFQNAPDKCCWRQLTFPTIEAIYHVCSYPILIEIALAPQCRKFIDWLADLLDRALLEDEQIHQEYSDGSPALSQTFFEALATRNAATWRCDFASKTTSILFGVSTQGP
jgi:hypothetical protein